MAKDARRAEVACLCVAAALGGSAAFAMGALWSRTAETPLVAAEDAEFGMLGLLLLAVATLIITLSRRSAARHQGTLESLRAAELRYNETFEQFPLSVQILHPDGNTIAVNRAWEKLFGGTLKDVKNWNWLESPAALKSGIAAHMRTALAGEMTVSPPQYRDMTQNWPWSTHEHGVGLWIKATICPVKDAEGRVTELIIVHEDVTEQKAAREARHESEARKAAIVEAALDCIISMDGEGRVIEWNPSAETTFGYSRDQTMGRLLADLIIPQEMRELHAQGMKRYMKTGEGPLVGRKIEVTALRADGAEFPVELAITTMVIGEGRIFSAFLRDLTHAKAVEAALLKAHNELESRVQQRTSELREALAQLQDNYEHLERLEALRDTLTGMVVHDLRTPLNSMLFGLQTVTFLGPVSEAQQECLDIFTLGCRDSLGVINDLLDIGKMESGAFVLQKEELRADDLVKHALERIKMLADVKQLQLDARVAPDLPAFSGDKEKLGRLLGNLLGNAIKFAPLGGIVTLGVELSADETALHLWVRDNGMGIPREAFDRIFEKFGQVETALGGGETSTGLGLAFCKMVVEAHHGSIWVESQPGQGSLFTASLPLAAAEAHTMTKM